MADKRDRKVQIRRDCFEEVLKLRRMSIRKLGDPNPQIGVGWSEKTIRRALEDGCISPILLDVLAKKLNIDPDFLSGKYHEAAERCEDPEIRRVWLGSIRAEKYPYILEMQRDRPDGGFLYDRYLENILVIHNISPGQFEAFPFEKQKELQIELETAICNVLLKHFETDAAGRDIYPEIFSLQAQIDCYDPNQPAGQG